MQERKKGLKLITTLLRAFQSVGGLGNKVWLGNTGLYVDPRIESLVQQPFSHHEQEIKTPSPLVFLSFLVKATDN